MKKIIIAIFLVASFPAIADENTENDMKVVIDMMVVAKAAGMCGVFSQMVNFQKTIKMPGGDEFIVRFLSTEAARLGHTLESFMAQCPQVVEIYDTNMERLGFEQ
ncbi:MAG: hypothetical protein OEX11_02350 [Nitrosomonas sp.]|nr:hypothetical protein [Nitrosomonas sp.]